MLTTEKKELVQVQNVESTNQLTSAIVNEVKKPLFDELKDKVKLSTEILTLNVLKLEIANMQLTKVIKSKEKVELFKLINSKLKLINDSSKVELMDKKESTKKPLSEKQTKVQNLSNEVRSISKLVKGAKVLQESKVEYSFLFKKSFSVSVINSFFTLNDFNSFLTKGDFLTESKFIAILDKVAKLDNDTLLIAYHVDKGGKINAIKNAYVNGEISFKEALTQFNEL
jgi:hypothetical protein